MRCERCNGLMVGEEICDLQGTNGDLCVDSFRCLLCGNVVDTMILENRQRSIDAGGSVTWTSPRMPRLVAV